MSWPGPVSIKCDFRAIRVYCGQHNPGYVSLRTRRSYQIWNGKLKIGLLQNCCPIREPIGLGLLWPICSGVAIRFWPLLRTMFREWSRKGYRGWDLMALICGGGYLPCKPVWQYPWALSPRSDFGRSVLLIFALLALADAECSIGSCSRDPKKNGFQKRPFRLACTSTAYRDDSPMGWVDKAWFLISDAFQTFHIIVQVLKNRRALPQYAIAAE